MKRVPKTRRRRTPIRTCVGCRKVESKRALIRVVRGTEGVEIDAGGKAPGRGAYLHDRRSCWESALHGPLARALRMELTPEALQALEAYMQTELSDEQDGQV